MWNNMNTTHYENKLNIIRNKIKVLKAQEKDCNDKLIEYRVESKYYSRIKNRDKTIAKLERKLMEKDND